MSVPSDTDSTGYSPSQQAYIVANGVATTALMFSNRDMAAFPYVQYTISVYCVPSTSSSSFN